jgi:hypothetical protein
MIHAEMADYYDFLNLAGFKRLHEYRFFDECAELRGMHRYFINHLGGLLDSSNVSRETVIPRSWANVTRSNVGNSTRREAVKSGFETWVSWETETKRMFEGCYSSLCDLGEIAAACKIRELVAGTDDELKRAERLSLSLKSCDYDMTYIVEIQDELHERYKRKTENIGVAIC